MAREMTPHPKPAKVKRYQVFKKDLDEWAPREDFVKAYPDQICKVVLSDDYDALRSLVLELVEAAKVLRNTILRCSNPWGEYGCDCVVCDFKKALSHFEEFTNDGE